MIAISSRPLPLLSRADPLPFMVWNEASSHPVLLTCEHAGGAIPSSLTQLGLDLDAFESVMEFAPQGDNHAGALARLLADRVNAILIESVYHRFIVDVNRGRDEEFWFRSAKNIEFPVNRNLAPEHIEQRAKEIWDPFDQAFQSLLRKQIAAHENPLVLSIHTYHKSLQRNEETFVDRPWEIGVLWDEPAECEVVALQNRQLGKICAAHFETFGLVVGQNEPYDLSRPNPSTGRAWKTTVHRHVSRLRLPSVMLEIRNDLLSTEKQLEDWVGKVAAMVPMLMTHRHLDVLEAWHPATPDALDWGASTNPFRRPAQESTCRRQRCRYGHRLREARVGGLNLAE